MNKLLAILALALSLWSAPAAAQCNGKFGASTLCGTVAGGPPGPIAFSSVTGNAITALTGDGTATGPGSVVFTLATVNSNVGTFGSATSCVVVTANAKGLITAISGVTCTPAFSSLTGQATLAQLPQLNANSIYANFIGSAAQPTQTTMTACANDGSHALVYVNGTGLQCASLNTSGTLAVGTTAVTGGNAHGVLTNNSGTLGNPSAGSVGQFLGSNGAVEPSMQSGPWTLLATLTPSGTPNTLGDTTHLTSTYNDYEIQFENIIPVTNNVTLSFQIHSGGSFQSTSYISSSICVGSGAGAFANPTTFVQLSEVTATQNTTAAGGVSGVVHINNPSQTSMDKPVQGQTAHSNGTVFSVCNFAGAWTGGTGAVDGFQIFFSSGNITSGTVKIYGRL